MMVMGGAVGLRGERQGMSWGQVRQGLKGPREILAFTRMEREAIERSEQRGDIT